MNTLALAQLSDLAMTAVAIAGIVVVIFIFIAVWAGRYTKVGPNQVLIVSGRIHRFTDGEGKAQVRGFRVVKGGGTFIMPVIERADLLSLELLTIDVQTPEVYTSAGVPLKVDGVAQIKVKGDDVSVATAAEQFLSKKTDDIKNIAMQTLEGHLRAILGTMTVEDIYRNRDAFAAKVQEVAAGDLANMGLTIVSFTIRDIRDSQGYLDALGKPRVAQVKRDATIALVEKLHELSPARIETGRPHARWQLLAHAPLAARNPASRSARMSSMVSMPTDRRTRSGDTPVVVCSASVSWEWVVDAG